MKRRTSVYVLVDVFNYWQIYAKWRGGLTNNKALEELTLYLFNPERLAVDLVDVEDAIRRTREEIESKHKTIRDGKW